MNAVNWVDFYTDEAAYGLFALDHRRAGGLETDFVRASQGDIEIVDPASHCFLLGISTGANGAAQVAVDFGEERREFETGSGAMYVNPTEGDTYYRQVGHHDLVYINVPLSNLAPRLGMEVTELSRGLRPLHEGAIVDAPIRVHALSLFRESEASGPFSALAIDQGVLALVAALMTRARPGERVLAAPPPRLDDARLQRVVDYAEAHLAEPIRLDDLAAVACFSIFHFSRAFKDATGLSPQRYVTVRRVERAKALLRGPMPLAQIAHACGFASQSHFGEVFRRHVGASPGAWRAAVAG